MKNNVFVYSIFCAVDDNDTVLGYGFCVLQSHVKDNNWPDITTLYIDDICVDGNAGSENRIGNNSLVWKDVIWS